MLRLKTSLIYCIALSSFLFYIKKRQKHNFWDVMINKMKNSFHFLSLINVLPKGFNNFFLTKISLKRLGDCYE